jgi:hypothetical protein
MAGKIGGTVKGLARVIVEKIAQQGTTGQALPKRLPNAGPLSNLGNFNPGGNSARENGAPRARLNISASSARLSGTSPQKGLGSSSPLMQKMQNMASDAFTKGAGVQERSPFGGGALPNTGSRGALGGVADAAFGATTVGKLAHVGSGMAHIASDVAGSKVDTMMTGAQAGAAIGAVGDQQSTILNQAKFSADQSNAATMAAAAISQKQALMSALASLMNKGAENIAKAATGQ